MVVEVEVEVEDQVFGLKHRKNLIPSPILLPHPKHKTAPPIISTANHRSRLPDFEFVSFKPPLSYDSYTSLKDILPSSPSSILSPTPQPALAGISSPSSGSSYEISIRNRLVKQAAWAYLQPAVLSSPSSSSRRFCNSGEFFRSMMDDFRRELLETVSRFYDWLVDAVWLVLCR